MKITLAAPSFSGNLSDADGEEVKTFLLEEEMRNDAKWLNHSCDRQMHCVTKA